MTLQEAFERAQLYLDQFIRPDHNEEILIDGCLETPEVWVFGYNTRGFFAGDITKSLIGNGPVVVPKSGGAPHLASVFEYKFPKP